jgi:spore coat polysaccharide biosynthesis protein SpsF (cytidylyltransferase family)
VISSLGEDWVVFIEARMNSSRLPGKVLYKFGEITALDLMVQRVSCILSMEIQAFPSCPAQLRKL